MANISPIAVAVNSFYFGNITTVDYYAGIMLGLWLNSTIISHLAAAPNIFPVLSYIFNANRTLSSYLPSRKLAIKIPVRKKSRKYSVHDFRPISLHLSRSVNI